MESVRVLHVNTSATAGGAARAAMRLHLALRESGVDSTMAVVSGDAGLPGVVQPLGSRGRFTARLAVAAASRLLRLQAVPSNPVMHSLNAVPSGLGAWINRSDHDIVHLHWVGDEALSIEEIGRIRKPVCWTLHDMWPFCGAEHYDDNDYPGRYRVGYDPGSRPAGSRGVDLDAWTWRRKQVAWRNRDFQLVGPSKWIAECAAGSALMGSQQCTVVPNCIDTAVFAPTDRAVARAAFDLSPGRRYILFGATGMSDPRKGLHLLREALAGIPAEDLARVELLTFGSSDRADIGRTDIACRQLGHIGDDRRLAQLYCAADVFVAPSLQDNLPNTVMEALSCGTPALAFRVGGMPDLIDHGVTGWLADPFSPAALAEGLLRLLDTGDSLRDRCRRQVEARFRPDLVARRYLDIYESMCARAH